LFLRLLNAIPNRELQKFVGIAGFADALLYYGVKETQTMTASLGFQGETGRGRYWFQLMRTATDALIFLEEEVDCPIATGSDSKRYVLESGDRETRLDCGTPPLREICEVLSGIHTLHMADTSETAKIRLHGYVEENRYLRSDGGNLAAFLYGLQRLKPAYYRRIVANIRQIAPFFDDFDFAPTRDSHSILLNWRDRDSTHLFGPHQLSDGTLRAMALVALLAQPEEELPGLIVLDEPEIGLHPFAIEILASLVKSASVHRPIVLATQSVALVNQFAPEDVVTVTREKAQSKFERQNSESLAAWLDDYAIGDLWEKNLIGGTPSR